MPRSFGRGVWEGRWLASDWLLVMGWSYAGLRAGRLDGLWNGYAGCWLLGGLAEGMVLKVGERLAGSTLARVNYAVTGVYDAFGTSQYTLSSRRCCSEALWLEVHARYLYPARERERHLYINIYKASPKPEIFASPPPAPPSPWGPQPLGSQNWAGNSVRSQRRRPFVQHEPT